MRAFPFYKQLDAMDCGPTCLRMVAKHYGGNYSLQKLRQWAEIGKEGVNLLGIARAAEQIGFRTLAVKTSVQKLAADAPLPCIVHWQQTHFVVVYRLQKNKILVADPAKGLISYSRAEFESAWATTVDDGERAGIALLLEPTPRFFERAEDEPEVQKIGFGSLSGYLWRYKGLLVQLGLGLLAGSVLQLAMPFLTQSVVDVGIQTRNLHFIQLILVAQLLLFVGRVSVNFIRSWILMHISIRLNLSILSDFLSKLLRLPISFFDTKHTGDIMQRIGDHSRIEQFLTGTSLTTLFSVMTLFVYGIVLATYHSLIFAVFLLFSGLYFGWIVLFLRYRRKLDFKRFALASQSQSSLIQLVTGIQEIKLNNAEHLKRWGWENLQVRQFKISMKGLALEQYQQAGALFFNEGKNILITFLAAQAVVLGNLTLGAMMAITYMVGQMNGPIEQLIAFIQHWQDAKISLERLNEIHEVGDESTSQALASPEFDTIRAGSGGLTVSDLRFTYPGAGNEPVLKGIDLHIPEGKVTAIVGTSGSGKTTLLKLLLKFHEPDRGEIRQNSTKLTTVPHHQWRSVCGTVLQDGFIFSDTVANNIAVSEENPDARRLAHAVKVANIQEFIESLPLGYNTKIGMEGHGLSQGQRQRLLIARAVYKDPTFLFFDEATNALDANNEAVIMRNLEEFFEGRTVVVVAHRLSTVKNADQIVVLEKGKIVEIGTHAELVLRHDRYFELVSNQLELGD